MQSIVAVCFLAVVAVALAHPGDDHYTNKYDGINIQEVVENKPLLNNYFLCLMGLRNCPPDGKELLKHIHEALENGCAKCTDKQKEGVHIMLKFLINKDPEKWAQLCAKFDPEGKYKSKYEKELKEASS